MSKLTQAVEEIVDDNHVAQVWRPHLALWNGNIKHHPSRTIPFPIQFQAFNLSTSEYPYSDATKFFGSLSS